jgi:hypothetical protein
MTKVASFIAASLLVSNAAASDWDVTQVASITTAAPTLNQGATTNVASSNQAVNAIVLDTTDDLVAGSQTATLDSSTGLLLTQGSNVDSSNQAINLVDGFDLGGTTSITQTVLQTGTSTTLLTQKDVDATGSNVQAVNLGVAGNDITGLKQVYTESDSVSLVQSDVVSSTNVQGLNYATAVEGIGGTELTQSVTVATDATFVQGAGNVGGTNVQVGNAAVANGAAASIANTAQTFTVTGGNLDLTQSVATVGGDTQAVNMISATGATSTISATTTQDVIVTAGAVNFTQDAAIGDNTQAGNLALAANAIGDLTQTFNASGASEVDFDQIPTAGSNTQAGNMVALTGTGEISEVLQLFSSSTVGATDFNQSSDQANLIQAGNLIKITSGGTINDASADTQTFTAVGGATAVTMTQDGGGSANLQALNGIVYDAAGLSNSATQTLTVASTSFTMTQDNISGSGQYGNFVGATL